MRDGEQRDGVLMRDRPSEARRSSDATTMQQRCRPLLVRALRIVHPLPVEIERRGYDPYGIEKKKPTSAAK